MTILQHHYRFGRYDFRPAKRQLLVDGAETMIGGRASDLLEVLIERRERIVSADELDQLVWPGLSVEPNNLKVQIWALRKLLGPQAIVTVPRRGYRFVLAVETLPDRGETPAAPAARQAVAPPAPALAQTLEERVAGLVRNGRLVTIVGGRTQARRHAAEAASRRMLHTTCESVFWIEASDLSRSEVGSVVRDNADWPLLERLTSRRALVVLFNCHRAPEPVGRFIDAAFARAKLLRIVATSQRALGFVDEQVLALANDTAAEPARLRFGGNAR